MSRFLRSLLFSRSPVSQERLEVPHASPVDSTPRSQVSEKGKSRAMTPEKYPGSQGCIGEDDVNKYMQSTNSDPPPPPSSEDHQPLTHHQNTVTPPAIGTSSSGARHKASVTKKFRKRQIFQPQFVLENSGSVARDHLASERTFLAYVRTSLAFASAGIALVQLFTIADLTSRNRDIPLSDAAQQVQKFARPVGLTMVLLGLLVLVIGVYRYFNVQNFLPTQQFPPARFSIAFISFVLGAITVVIFGALLSGRTLS